MRQAASMRLVCARGNALSALSWVSLPGASTLLAALSYVHIVLLITTIAFPSLQDCVRQGECVILAMSRDVHCRWQVAFHRLTCSLLSTCRALCPAPPSPGCVDVAACSPTSHAILHATENRRPLVLAPQGVRTQSRRSLVVRADKTVVIGLAADSGV
jgi:hypothetical protein